MIPSLTQLASRFNGDQFEDGCYRFENGELPTWLEEESKQLKIVTQKGAQSVAKIADLIAERVKDGELANRLAEPALAELGFYIQRMDNLAQVWNLMVEPQREKGAPLARWLEVAPEREGDFVVNVSPLEVGWQLDQQLWSAVLARCLSQQPCERLTRLASFVAKPGSARSQKTA